MKILNNLTPEQMEKIAHATLMLEDSPVEDVILHTGVELKYLQAGAYLINRPEWLDDTNKPVLNPNHFYNSIEPNTEDDGEDPATRFQNAINRVQNACSHPHGFFRCAKCFKILGSEINYFSIEKVFQLAKDIEYDLKDPSSPDYNQGLKDFGLQLTDLLYKEVLFKLEDEEPLCL